MIYLYLSIFAAPTLNLVRTKDVFFIGKTADAVNTEESIFIKTGSMYFYLFPLYRRINLQSTKRMRTQVLHAVQSNSINFLQRGHNSDLYLYCYILSTRLNEKFVKSRDVKRLGKQVVTNSTYLILVISCHKLSFVISKQFTSYFHELLIQNYKLFWFF